MMRSYDTVGELVQVAGCLFGVRAFALFQMNLTHRAYARSNRPAAPEFMTLVPIVMEREEASAWK